MIRNSKALQFALFLLSTCYHVTGGTLIEEPEHCTVPLDRKINKNGIHDFSGTMSLKVKKNSPIPLDDVRTLEGVVTEIYKTLTGTCDQQGVIRELQQVGIVPDLSSSSSSSLDKHGDNGSTLLSVQLSGICNGCAEGEGLFHDEYVEQIIKAPHLVNMYNGQEVNKDKSGTLRGELMTSKNKASSAPLYCHCPGPTFEVFTTSLAERVSELARDGQLQSIVSLAEDQVTVEDERHVVTKRRSLQRRGFFRDFISNNSPCPDGDRDGDTICDGDDNCPDVFNPGQLSMSGQGMGDACACLGVGDADGDGICDNVDNCPENYNPQQQDADGDGIGDWCTLLGAVSTNPEPSQAPTAPTQSPTKAPTASPTTSPTKSPTVSPTKAPTVSPTKSSQPSTSPTPEPTSSPTKSPTRGPTASPTTSPTSGPTRSPTASPTRVPTTSPTGGPTTSPTKSPTGSPTESPTASPTKSPTTSPTGGPTTSPTKSPTGGPTSSPTKSPTGSPTESPTASPTKSPTGGPTSSPTKSPTGSPTESPTASPTKAPTTAPISIAPPPFVDPPANPNGYCTETPRGPNTGNFCADSGCSVDDFIVFKDCKGWQGAACTIDNCVCMGGILSDLSECDVDNRPGTPDGALALRDCCCSNWPFLSDDCVEPVESPPTASPTKSPTGSPTESPTASPTKAPTTAPISIAPPPVADPPANPNGYCTETPRGDNTGNFCADSGCSVDDFIVFKDCKGWQGAACTIDNCVCMGGILSDLSECAVDNRPGTPPGAEDLRDCCCTSWPFLCS